MLPDTGHGNSIKAIVLLVFSAAFLLLQHMYEPPVTGLWAETFFNSLHVPVFGVVAAGLYIATASQKNWTDVKRIVVVCIAVLVLSVISEAAQIPGPRDASVRDLVSDWLGAVAAIALIRAYNINQIRNRRHKICAAMFGTTILLIALSSLIGVSAAYVERHYQFPILVSFDGRFSEYFRRPQNSTLKIIEHRIYAESIGQVTLGDGAWPGIVFHDIQPDWSAHSVLIFEFGLDSDSTLDIHIRVHDLIHSRGDQPPGDRFNRTIALRPGRQSVKIPLQEIRNAPENREMDLSRIDGIAVFCSRNDTGRTFDLVEIRLQ